MKLIVDGKPYTVSSKQGQIVVENTPFGITIRQHEPQLIVEINGRAHTVERKGLEVVVDGVAHKVEKEGTSEARSSKAKSPQASTTAILEKGAIKAMMPGRVIAVKVREGNEVTADTVLLVIEAMKMENEIRAPRAGKVKKLVVTEGATVNNGDTLVVLE